MKLKITLPNNDVNFVPLDDIIYIYFPEKGPGQIQLAPTPSFLDVLKDIYWNAINLLHGISLQRIKQQRAKHHEAFIISTKIAQLAQDDTMNLPIDKILSYTTDFVPYTGLESERLIINARRFKKADIYDLSHLPPELSLPRVGVNICFDATGYDTMVDGHPQAVADLYRSVGIVMGRQLTPPSCDPPH